MSFVIPALIVLIYVVGGFPLGEPIGKSGGTSQERGSGMVLRLGNLAAKATSKCKLTLPEGLN